MGETLQRTGREIRELYGLYADTVYRVAFLYLRNRQDSEDAVQETFLRLMNSGRRYPDPGKEKAWLIVTASNLCKDMLRRKHRSDVPLDECAELAAAEKEDREVLSAVLALPEKYRSCVYLFYYEGYSVAEIAAMLRRSPGTIKTWLSRGRKALRDRLGGEFDD